MKFYKNILFLLVVLLIKDLCSVEKFSVFDGQTTKKVFTPVVKNITKSGTWSMIEGGIYTPVKSCPVIQVKSSGVTLDLQQYALECKPQGGLVATGIEVGYCKAELEANPSLRQIANVTIKNACFVNFDVGIIVHEGVNTLTIQDCNFDGVSVGIIFLGTKNRRESSTISAMIKNSIIIGHGLDQQEKLVLLKDRIEKEYKYGVDSFIPLFEDFLCNNEKNVYSYAGIVANYVSGLRIDNVRIQNMGYHDYMNQSESNGRKTAVFGIRCFKCADVTIENSYLFSNFSEVYAVGIQLVCTRNVQLKNLDVIYQRSACKSCGIEALDLGSLNKSQEQMLFTRERTIALDNVRCELNLSCKTDFTHQAQELSVGICIKGVFSLQANKLICEGINGHKQSYGLYGVGLLNSTFKNSAFNQSKSNRDENDISEGYGIVAMGAYIQNSNGLTFDSCDFSNNIGKNTGIGLALKAVNNTECVNCQFSGNKGLIYKCNEVESGAILGSIRQQQDTQEISNYGPVVQASHTGGYGFRGDYCKRFALKNCESKNNSGHRAFGYALHNSGVLAIENSSSYYQHGYGDFVHPDIEMQKNDGIVPDAYKVPVLDIHKPLLFNSIYSKDFVDSDIDMKQLAGSFLSVYKNIRDTWLLDKKVSLEQERLLVKNLLSLLSVLARFRLWGVAYGVHMHNCIGTLVKNSRFGGQISEKDNAAGLVQTGRCSDFYLEDSELSFNYGWTDSVGEDIPVEYDTKYDLSAILPFFKSIIKTYDQKSFQISENSLIVHGQKELDGSGNDVEVVIEKNSYSYMNIFAPVSAGLIIADFCHGGTIMNNKFHGNKGFAGYCTGLLLHAAENFLIQKNIIDDNGSNIYGHCIGLADLNLYSENSYVQNKLSFNRVDGYYNSHTLVIADTRSGLSVVYPKVELNNGVSSTVQKDVDNVESLFPMVGKQEKKNSKKS